MFPKYFYKYLYYYEYVHFFYDKSCSYRCNKLDSDPAGEPAGVQSKNGPRHYLLIACIIRPVSPFRRAFWYQSFDQKEVYRMQLLNML
ncbi:MAG TPA: hypothetical protein DDW50_21825 [Firmicutes bacterium]|nr:hypothetical protein [Bacillota bacterium]